MRKVRWGDFITLLSCPYHIKAKRSTVRDSQNYSPRATRIYYYHFLGKITFSLSHASLRWECHFSAFQAPLISKKQQASEQSIANIKVLVFDYNAMQVKK